jgi:hypothetical protein
MSSAKSISIDLPADLVAEVRRVAADEGRTAKEVFPEVVRRRVDEKYPERDALLSRTRAHVRALGVETEADVERMCEEYDRERRR